MGKQKGGPAAPRGAARGRALGGDGGEGARGAHRPPGEKNKKRDTKIIQTRNILIFILI